jgi:hypothetical protein
MCVDALICQVVQRLLCSANLPQADRFHGRVDKCAFPPIYRRMPLPLASASLHLTGAELLPDRCICSHILRNGDERDLHHGASPAVPDRSFYRLQSAAQLRHGRRRRLTPWQCASEAQRIFAQDAGVAKIRAKYRIGRWKCVKERRRLGRPDPE